MKINLKKALAFVLVLALTLTMFSGTAFAKGWNPRPTPTPVPTETPEVSEPSETIKVKLGKFSNGSVEIKYGTKTKQLDAKGSVEFNRKDNVDTFSVEAIDLDKGYMLSEWIDADNVSLGDDNPLSRAVYEDEQVYEVTPVIADTVELTVIASPAHGGNVDAKINGEWETVYDEKTFDVAIDSKVKIEAFREKEDDKYKFISFGGDVTSNDDEITVTMSGDKTVVANFRAKVEPILEFIVDDGNDNYTAHFGYEVDGQESVIISVGSSNKIFGGGVSGQNMGQPITFSPGRHYDAFSVEFNGTTLSWKLENKTVEAKVDEEELRFTVRPTLFAYGDVKIENAISGGDIVFDGETFEGGAREIYVPCYTYGEPTKLTLTAIPDSGLSFYSWEDNSSTLNPRTLTFKESWFGTKKMLQEPAPIFETGEVMLSIVAETGGSTSISKKVYDAGDVVDISAIANYITTFEGYQFVGFDEYASDFQIYNDQTLTAEFVQSDKVVLYVLTDGNGTATKSYFVYDSNSVVDLSDIATYLSADSGYVFSGFTEQNSDFIIAGSTTLTANFVAVSSDVPKTGDESTDLSIAWMLAMILPLLGALGYKVAKRLK